MTQLNGIKIKTYKMGSYTPQGVYKDFNIWTFLFSIIKL